MVPLSKSGVAFCNRGFKSHPLRGEVLEWSIRHAWRACDRVIGPRVRIPPSPPISKNIQGVFRLYKSPGISEYLDSGHEDIR